MRILFASTNGVTCGIADYNDDMMRVLQKPEAGHVCDVEALPQDGLISRAELKRIADRAKRYDCLVIQHEWSFIGRGWKSYLHLAYFLRCLRKNKVPTALIMHSRFPPMPGMLSRDFMHRPGAKAVRRILLMEINRNPFLTIFVHGHKTKEHMVSFTIRADKVEAITFPQQVISGTQASLRRTDNSISLVMFGFLSPYKGYEVALNALRLLPQNFRLTLVGDLHPRVPEDELVFDNILGFIHRGIWPRRSQVPPVGEAFTPEERQDFAMRITITGHLPMDAVVKEIDRADIVLAPYLYGPGGSAAVALPIALGKPTIVSAIDTFDDMIKAKCVVPVTPGGAYHLAREIRMLADDADKRKRLSERALQFSLDNRIEAVTNKIINTTRLAHA